MKRKPKIDVVITTHNEGLLAHTSLIAFDSARRNITDADIRFLVVLDEPSESTIDAVYRCPVVRRSDKIVRVNCCDLGMSRNVGIKLSDADYLCVLDGDDLVGNKYFSAHIQAIQQAEAHVILHPEIIVSFGKYNSFSWQFHQPGEYFDPFSLLVLNFWASPSFARRVVYDDVLYCQCDTKNAGFGYEDWHWNCETLAKEYVHELAWGSVYFYRRKQSASMNERALRNNAVMPPSRFFEQIKLWK